jgi:hypothetical protein
MFHVYGMASRRKSTLYIGMTADLNRRVWEHQTAPSQALPSAIIILNAPILGEGEKIRT